MRFLFGLQLNKIMVSFDITINEGEEPTFSCVRHCCPNNSKDSPNIVSSVFQLVYLFYCICHLCFSFIGLNAEKESSQTDILEGHSKLKEEVTSQDVVSLKLEVTYS